MEWSFLGKGDFSNARSKVMGKRDEVYEIFFFFFDKSILKDLADIYILDA